MVDPINVDVIQARKKTLWFTCTPFRFVGDETFFSRDSGLLCRGFQEIGVNCKAIMPGPKFDSDLNDIIRTDYKNLESSDWWKSLGGQGVVLYGWGLGKYYPIARAIRNAGLFFISHIDSAGILGVFNGLNFIKSKWNITLKESDNKFIGISYFVLRIFYASTFGLVFNDLNRAKHFKMANYLGAVSPFALNEIQRVCRCYGGKKLVDKVKLIPHPIAPYMRYDIKISKERLVVAVGRWDDSKVKGTEILIKVIEELIEKDKEIKVEIYGALSKIIINWYTELPSVSRDRIKLMGNVSNIELSRAYQRSIVSLCTSLRESYHIVSAEALCCGCAVVGSDVLELPSFKWFTEGPFGTLAKRSVESLTEAVILELKNWDEKNRNAEYISNHWCNLLHSSEVAQSIIKLYKSYNSRNF